VLRDTADRRTTTEVEGGEILIFKIIMIDDVTLWSKLKSAR